MDPSQQQFNIDITQTGQPTLIPIPVYACHKCGHVNDEFQPKDDSL